MSLTIVVHGANGRMGQAVCALVDAAPDLRLLPLTRGSWPASIISPAVVVDFSLPPALPALLQHCRSAGLPLVSGTTGLDSSLEQAMQSLAAEVPVLWAANFSLGVALLRRAAVDLARRLPSDWDCGLLDLHHRHKLDAPSGTARMLAQSVDAARPTGARATDVASVRLGGVPGEHRIVFAGPSERIELAHHADRRDLFAAGALLAARWLATQPAGRYQFDDVVDAGVD